MAFFPSSLENLIDKFASLPGVGKKSAQRLAFHMLSLPDQEADAFADAITRAKHSVHFCSVCQNFTGYEGSPRGYAQGCCRGFLQCYGLSGLSG